MKRILGFMLLIACLDTVWAETAEARLFGRRRCRSSGNCYSTCNSGCMPQGGPMMDGQDPNLPPGGAPNAAPGAPPMTGQQPVPGQTFYRGNPNLAPQSGIDGRTFSTQPNGTGAGFQGQTNLSGQTGVQGQTNGQGSTGNIQGSLNGGTSNRNAAGTVNGDLRTNTAPNQNGNPVRANTNGVLNQD